MGATITTSKIRVEKLIFTFISLLMLTRTIFFFKIACFSRSAVVASDIQIKDKVKDVKQIDPEAAAKQGLITVEVREQIEFF